MLISNQTNLQTPHTPQAKANQKNERKIQMVAPLAIQGCT